MSLIYLYDDRNQLALVDPDRGLYTIVMDGPPMLDIARSPDGMIWGGQQHDTLQAGSGGADHKHRRAARD